MVLSIFFSFFFCFVESADDELDRFVSFIVCLCHKILYTDNIENKKQKKEKLLTSRETMISARYYKYVATHLDHSVWVYYYYYDDDDDDSIDSR